MMSRAFFAEQHVVAGTAEEDVVAEAAAGDKGECRQSGAVALMTSSPSPASTSTVLQVGDAGQIV